MIEAIAKDLRLVVGHLKLGSLQDNKIIAKEIEERRRQNEIEKKREQNKKTAKNGERRQKLQQEEDRKNEELAKKKEEEIREAELRHKAAIEIQEGALRQSQAKLNEAMEGENREEIVRASVELDKGRRELAKTLNQQVATPEVEIGGRFSIVEGRTYRDISVMMRLVDNLQEEDINSLQDMTVALSQLMAEALAVEGR